MTVNVPPNLTKRNYGRRFMDAGYWRPYVRMVCRRHDLLAESVQAGFAGTYTLLHEFDILKAVRRKHPEVTELDSLAQLMDMTWDPDVRGLEEL